MDNSTDFPRLEKLLRLLKFLEAHPYAELLEIVDGCGISQATFYRLVHAAEGLEVHIEFGTVYPCNPSKTRSGYRIVSYGVINRKYLKGISHE